MDDATTILPGTQWACKQITEMKVNSFRMSVEESYFTEMKELRYFMCLTFIGIFIFHIGICV